MNSTYGGLTHGKAHSRGSFKLSGCVGRLKLLNIVLVVLGRPDKGTPDWLVLITINETNSCKLCFSLRIFLKLWTGSVVAFEIVVVIKLWLVSQVFQHTFHRHKLPINYFLHVTVCSNTEFTLDVNASITLSAFQI